MNRRDFLAAGFKLGAAGLLLPGIEPARKVWALDRTMIPERPWDNSKACVEWCDPGGPDIHIATIEYGGPSRFEISDFAMVYTTSAGERKRLPLYLQGDGSHGAITTEPGTVIGLEYVKRPTIRYAATS